MTDEEKFLTEALREKFRICGPEENHLETDPALSEERIIPRLSNILILPSPRSNRCIVLARCTSSALFSDSHRAEHQYLDQSNILLFSLSPGEIEELRGQLSDMKDELKNLRASGAYT